MLMFLNTQGVHGNTETVMEFTEVSPYMYSFSQLTINLIKLPVQLFLNDGRTDYYFQIR